MAYFVGVDGGGSTTRAVIVNEALSVVGRGQSGASNHYVVGPDQAANHCREAVEGAIHDAGRLEPDLRLDRIVSWGFGLAGVRRENDAAVMRAHLQSIVPPRQSWALDTDAAAAQHGAFAGGPGVVLSAGTGAICLGIDSEDERFYADGCGPLLGDEGGGYWMGMEALRAVCRAADGRGPRTRLTGSILHSMNVPNAEGLVSLVNSGRCSREQIAGLSQIILDVATGGSQVAISIRERAVNHLADTATAVVRTMLMRAQERMISGQIAAIDMLIAMRGGLFEDDFFRASVGYYIGERMVELKRDFLPLASWRIVKPQFDAAVGAALLARKQLAA
jgi:N-acetylglucosamine kinase-like BadF-type ATPase